MNTMRIAKYPVKQPLLQPLIKYIWVLRSDHPVTICHKLLPVTNIDIILNFSSTINYRGQGDNAIAANRFHLNGIRQQYQYISQTDRLNVWGISFYPDGLYPFVKIPLSEFTNQTVELELLMPEFTCQAGDIVSCTGSIPQRLSMLENALVKSLNVELISEKNCLIFDLFNSTPGSENIKRFCVQHGINQRRLERIFNKHIGISPKQFLKLRRFQRILGQIRKHQNRDFLGLTYENDYFDQAHFIKDFKSLTGCSPTRFICEKSSILQYC